MVQINCKQLKKVILLAICNALFLCIGYSQNISHPLWSYQTNIYEVNLRQYSPSGSIKDFQKHLPRLKKMGVEILWFMPITPIGVEGRKMNESELGSYYAVKNYKEVNPEFGTMADWKALVKRAHSMGFKVITDWVPNHSAPDNPWIKNHPDFYCGITKTFWWLTVFIIIFKNFCSLLISRICFWNIINFVLRKKRFIINGHYGIHFPGYLINMSIR
jgi:hypothetical protein